MDSEFQNTSELLNHEYCEHGRRDKHRREEMSQYGEYGAEIRAEYIGDY